MKAPLHTTPVPLLLALVAAGFTLRPSTLHAQCNPDSSVCVHVEVDGSSPHAPPPAPPAPAAEPAPLPPVPQPPRVIIIEGESTPPPAPEPPPPPPAAEPPPPPPPAPEPEPHPWDGTPAPRDADPRLGIQTYVAGVGGRDVNMGGFGSAFRIRPLPHFAVDLGIGFFGGQDYNGMDRFEVPFTADLLVFVNPRSRLQLYFVGGLGVSFGMVDGYNVHLGTYDQREFRHVGAHTGVGLEWRIGRHFALNADFRAFIRQRVDNNDPWPEFSEPYAGGMRSTDTSAGTVGRLGATFYFGSR
jgi:hypothetical protein